MKELIPWIGADDGLDLDTEAVRTRISKILYHNEQEV